MVLLRCSKIFGNTTLIQRNPRIREHEYPDLNIEDLEWGERLDFNFRLTDPLWTASEFLRALNVFAGTGGSRFLMSQNEL